MARLPVNSTLCLFYSLGLILRNKVKNFIFINFSLVLALLIQCCSMNSPSLLHKKEESIQQSQPTNSRGVWGNWCGPDHPREFDINIETTDVLDAICKVHDICYYKKGYCDTDCNRDLLDNINKADINWNKPLKKVASEIIELTFGVVPSIDINNPIKFAISPRHNGVKSSFGFCSNIGY